MRKAGSYSQLIYYAKGWFKVTDKIEDLKKLLGKRSGLRPESVNEHNIINVLNNAIEEVVEIRNPSRFLIEFLSDIDPNNFSRRMFDKGKEYDFRTAVIDKYMSILSLLKIREGDEILVELEEPDFSILGK